MCLMLEVRKLVDYMETIPNFHNYVQDFKPYNHMGATITDSILQAGLNYNSVVKPRVAHLLRQYPSANTTRGFLDLQVNLGLKEMINWNHPEKIERISILTNMFFENDIETEQELINWVLIDTNINKLLNIKGIGPKTVDYIKNLIGISTVAVDRHVKKFVQNAGVLLNSYDDIKKVVEYAADISNIPRHILDKKIWTYMNANKQLELAY